MHRVFRWLDGFLRIKIYGDSPERFLNLCTKNAIRFYHIERDNENMILSMQLRDFYRIKQSVRKAGIRVVILKRYGLPFFIVKVKKRCIFVLGILFCLAFLLTMKNYVWAMEYSGNITITDDILIDYMGKQGIDYGTRIADISFEELEMKLREDFDEITWASVGIKGTKLIVNLKEKDSSLNHEDFAEYEASDLVAATAGYVQSIVTRAGRPLVKEGDYVNKGMILVSGELPVQNTDGTILMYNYVNADADILIMHDYSYYDTVPKYVTIKKYTGREKNYGVVRMLRTTLKLQLPYDKTNWDTVTQYYQFRLFENYYMPLWYGKRTAREYRMISHNRNTSEMKEELEDRIAKLIATFKEKGVQIIEKDVKIYDGNVYMKCSGRIRMIEACIERVKNQPTTIQQNVMDESEQSL